MPRFLLHCEDISIFGLLSLGSSFKCLYNALELSYVGTVEILLDYNRIIIIYYYNYIVIIAAIPQLSWKAQIFCLW